MRRYSSGSCGPQAAGSDVYMRGPVPPSLAGLSISSGAPNAPPGLAPLKEGVPPSPSSPFLNAALDTAIHSVEELFNATSPAAQTATASEYEEWRDGLRRSAALWSQRSPLPEPVQRGVWDSLGGASQPPLRHEGTRRATTGNIFQYPTDSPAAANTPEDPHMHTMPIFMPGAQAHVPMGGSPPRTPPTSRSGGTRRSSIDSPSIRIHSASNSPRNSPAAVRRESSLGALSTPSGPPPSENPEFANRYRYLFIDNGNVFVGAQSTADGSMDLAVRVNVKELGDLLEEKYPCVNREVAASRPSNPRICSAWQKVGYAVHTDTHSRSGPSARQSLAIQVSKTVLDPRLEGKPQTLVLATGDGSQFPQLAELALQRGWNVIVWSWNRCLSDKFRKLRTEFPDLLELRLLDQHRDRITFRAAERGREAPPAADVMSQRRR